MFAEKQASSVCLCVAAATLPDTCRACRELQAIAKAKPYM